MTLDRNFMKILLLNVSMEMSVFGHQSKSRTTRCLCNKKQTVKVRDQMVDLKETKNLYGRLMVLTRSNWDIDQKDAVGNYEFTLLQEHFFHRMDQCCHVLTNPI